MQTEPSKSREIELGLDFILGLFQAPIFPRKISTKASHGGQFLVNSKQEVIAKFKESNYTDCRINAFPFKIEESGHVIQPSNFIMTDIDRNQFDSRKSLDKALNKSLEKLSEINGHPTILHTGNGYHLYQPISGFVLEGKQYFKEFGIDRISQKFLKFASINFSDGKSDPNFNPSFRSCLLRVPNTINSKNGETVKIVERWDGYRPSINLMIGDFCIYLRKERIKEQKKLSNLPKPYNNMINNSDKYKWIETLLQIGIDDYRKNTVSLILSPYLLHIRKLDSVQTYEIIIKWLDKCREKKSLDFNTHSKIKEAIKTAIKDRIPPMTLDTLKKNNKALYDILNTK